mmetsp:Transcript_30274/g.78525  ORF Transcript_30274/g.78525 Transcript_30274/m.78525 type:complete len:274 (+) Transcript_30274:93-914(+)
MGNQAVALSMGMYMTKCEEPSSRSANAHGVGVAWGAACVGKSHIESVRTSREWLERRGHVSERKVMRLCLAICILELDSSGLLLVASHTLDLCHPATDALCTKLRCGHENKACCGIICVKRRANRLSTQQCVLHWQLHEGELGFQRGLHKARRLAGWWRWVGHFAPWRWQLVVIARLVVLLFARVAKHTRLLLHRLRLHRILGVLSSLGGPFLLQLLLLGLHRVVLGWRSRSALEAATRLRHVRLRIRAAARVVLRAIEQSCVHCKLVHVSCR